MADQSRVLVSQPAQALVESAEWLFGPAWTVILGLAAWAGVLAWTSTSDPEAHSRIAVLFGINIFFHLLWTPLFFNLRRPDWALIEVAFLWFSVAALMIGLAPYSAKASLLLLPYLFVGGFRGLSQFGHRPHEWAVWV